MRLRFAADMVRLGIWYVRHLVASRRIPRAQIADALTRRVNLYRLTTLWDGRRDPALGHHDPRWEPLLRQLCDVVADDAGIASETTALELLAPYLSPQPEPPPPQAFGCWSFQLVGEGVADRPGRLGRLTNPRKLWQRARRALGGQSADRHAELHFRNDTAPKSPFADPLQLTRSLYALVAEVKRAHPTVQHVWCSTWLNSRQCFLELFPASWREGAVDRSPDAVDAASFGKARLNTDDWWGQFLRADGSFHAERARRFRESGGTFPLPNRTCHATIEAVERHLAAQLERGSPQC